MMTSILYARSVVTSNDFSPVVGVVNWFMMVFTILTTCTRICMKIVVSRALNTDDFSILCATIFSIAQTIAVAVQARHGIGRHEDSLSQDSIDIYEKAGYSSELLFIINLALSKISVLVLLRQITPARPHQITALSTMVFIGILSIGSFFTSAFQCGIPNPWKILGSRCFNQVTFWTFFGAMNILTEIVIIGLAIHVLWEVQIRRNTRWTIIACFAIRISIIGAVIAQLVLLRRISKSTDKTFDGWPYDLSTVIVQNLSIITACVPFVKNFMVGLESGMIRIDDQERRRQMGSARNTSSNHYNSNHGGKYARKPSALAAGTSASGRMPSGSGQENTDLELWGIDNMTQEMRPEPVFNTTSIRTTAGQSKDGNYSSDEGRIRATTEIIVNHGY